MRNHRAEEEQVSIGPEDYANYAKKLERIALIIPVSNDIPDEDGNPMEIRTYRKLVDFAMDYLATHPELKTKAADADFIKSLAKRIESDFRFKHQGTGIATTSKQLESYNNGHTEPEFFDCKFPTIILGVILNSFIGNGILSLKLLIGQGASHPHLLVELQSEVIKIDFIVKSETNTSEVQINEYDKSSKQRVIDKLVSMTGEQHQTFGVRMIRKLDLRYLSD